MVFIFEYNSFFPIINENMRINKLKPYLLILKNFLLKDFEYDFVLNSDLGFTHTLYTLSRIFFII